MSQKTKKYKNMEEAMKTMKRVLSCALAILLVVAALPLSASAATTGKVGSITAKIVDIPNTKDQGLFNRPSAREETLVKNHPNGKVPENEDGSASNEANFQTAMAEFDKVIKPTTATGSGTEAAP